MADNYLEYRWEEYEKRKSIFRKKQTSGKSSPKRNIERPADEAL